MGRLADVHQIWRVDKSLSDALGIDKASIEALKYASVSGHRCSLGWKKGHICPSPLSHRAGPIMSKMTLVVRRRQFIPRARALESRESAATAPGLMVPSV